MTGEISYANKMSYLSVQQNRRFVISKLNVSWHEIFDPMKLENVFFENSKILKFQKILNVQIHVRLNVKHF